jgi:hypothetical protein
MVLKWSIGIKASTRVLKRQHFESKKIVPSFMTYQDEFVCFKETVQYYECELVGPSCVTIQFADKSMSFKATVSRGWIISFHELTVSGSFHAFQRDSITWVTRKWDPPPLQYGLISQIKWWESAMKIYKIENLLRILSCHYGVHASAATC